MKVGVLIDRIIVGGVEKIAIEEVAALRAAGYDASLLVLSRNYEEPKAFADQLRNIPVIHLEDRLPRTLRFSFKIPLFAFFSFFHISYAFLLPFVIKKREFDWILSQNTYTTFTALALSKRRNIPYAIYMQDHVSYLFKNAYPAWHTKIIFSIMMPLARATDSMLLNNSVAAFVNGEDHHADLSLLMKDSSKLFFISPGHSTLQHLPKKRGNYFLLASAWKDGKKLEHLFAAVKPSDGFKFKIAGKWIHQHYQKRILEQIKVSGLGNNVEIVGEVSEQQLDLLYQGALASLIYSNEKGFGMTSIEAASNGCTFIIPNNCGAARCFRHEVDGFLYRFGDYQALHQYMTRLTSDAHLAYRMGLNAWKLVSKKYSWQSHIKTIVDAIEQGMEVST